MLKGGVSFLVLSVLLAQQVQSFFLAARPSLIIGVLHPGTDDEGSQHHDPFVLHATISQPVDHSNPRKYPYWNQLYQYKLGHNRDGPILIGIPGEYPMDEWWITKGTLAESVVNLKASAVFQLEHRFYGESWPLPDASVANLKYLSVQQVLGDIGSFIEYVRSKYNLQHNKVILYGGSYSGSLVTYFQEFHPGLADISVASSGVFDWKMDTDAILKDTHALYQKTSHSCASILTRGLHELGHRSNLLPLETCNGNLDSHHPLDRDVLTQNILDILLVLATHNTTLNSLSRVCSAVELYKLQTGNDYAALAKVMGDLNQFVWKRRCFDASWDNSCSVLKDISKGAAKKTTWSRQWFWQTCSELATFPARSPDGSGFGLTPSYYAAMCGCVFGDEFTESFVSSRVERFKAIYGGLERARPNVIHTVGTHDVYQDFMYGPHHPLPRPNVYQSHLIVMPGVSHCADANGLEYANDPAVVHGIKQMNALMEKMIH